MNKKNKIITYLFSLLILLTTFWVLTKIFICDCFYVPSISMFPSLYVGDKVVVNKMIIGPRIYKEFDFSDGHPINSIRLRGRRNLQTGDVVVFNYPLGMDNDMICFKINYVYVKRVAATPGDTINNSGNGKKILVPGRNVSVPITADNIDVYGKVIEYETKESALNYLGQPYNFLKDYYYMLGDNRVNSNDSRSWGFVPEEFVIGVATYIFYSRDISSHKFRWGRFIQRIDNFVCT